MARYEEALTAIEAAQGPLKAARALRKQVVGLAKASGMPEWRLKQRHDEMSRPTSENADNIAAEARERRWYGIITPEQLKMHTESGTPQEVMDEEDAKTEGFKRGVRGLSAELPDGLHARLTQPFLQGHAAGRTDYMLTLATNVPKPKETTAEQIAADAEGILAQDEIDAAAKRLKNSDFMERGPAEEPFEATPEELAAQTLRPSVQEAEGDSVL